MVMAPPSATIFLRDQMPVSQQNSTPLNFYPPSRRRSQARGRATFLEDIWLFSPPSSFGRCHHFSNFTCCVTTMFGRKIFTATALPVLRSPPSSLFVFGEEAGRDSIFARSFSA